MNWFEKSILILFPSWAAKRAEARYLARQFTGADLDRLRIRNAYSNVGPITENRQSRTTLLNVARNLDRNNSFAHGAFNAIANNIVGKGIKLESRVQTTNGKLLEGINRDIENVWREWARGADITGKMDFYEIQHLVERELWVAGEILVANVSPLDKRKVPLALEIIESERLSAIDDENGKNRIVQGVEYTDQGKIVAYHIHKNNPADSIYGDKIERIPASRVLHLFRSIRPNQVRGLSRIAPVARNFEAIGQFMDHELTKARVASAFALMIKRGGLGYAPKFPNTGDSTIATDANGNVVDNNNNPLGHLEGGMIFYGGPNDSIEGTGPSVQASAFAEFIATNLRAIATGLNISYELLARDFTKTNFSSARQSSLEDKKHWEPLQQYLNNHLNDSVYNWFIDRAIIAGVNPFARNTSRQYLVEWILPPREYVDPLKEVDADIKAVQSGFTNLQKICSKHGTDAHDNLRLNSQLLKDAEEQGLNVTALLKPKTNEKAKEYSNSSKFAVD